MARGPPARRGQGADQGLPRLPRPAEPDRALLRHECASAYAILFLRFPACVPEGERLRVSAMAAWHMVPFFFSNEHTRARYLRLWGEDFLRDMEALDRADRAAQR